MRAAGLMTGEETRQLTRSANEVQHGDQGDYHGQYDEQQRYRDGGITGRRR